METIKKVVSKFHVGKHLTKGRVYEVNDITEGFYSIIGDEGVVVYFLPEKFEDYKSDLTNLLKGI